MEDKEMEELLMKFKRGEIKATDLDQETAERYLAFLKVHLRERIDRIKELDEDTARINKEAEKVAQDTKKIREETKKIKKENEELAKRLLKANEIQNANEEEIRKILAGEE